jgi:hypothetical protein
MPIMPLRRPLILLAVLAALAISGCGGTPSPLQKINQALKDIPTYSVILEDMKEEGDFFPEYFHKYKIVIPDSESPEKAPRIASTDWMPVSADFYLARKPFLGMTIFVKKDGKAGGVAAPPGYAYVGDQRYGRWRTDSSGRSFWEFFGMYALMSHLLGPRPIYRGDYDRYRSYRGRRRPYFGSAGPGRSQPYGTAGSYTKTSRPTFYQRRMARSRSSFSSKFRNRVGRTRTGFRSRGGGWGK